MTVEAEGGDQSKVSVGDNGKFSHDIVIIATAVCFSVFRVVGSVGVLNGSYSACCSDSGGNRKESDKYRKIEHQHEWQVMVLVIIAVNVVFIFFIDGGVGDEGGDDRAGGGGGGGN